MSDNPFQSPASVEYKPPNSAWRVPWVKLLFFAILLFLVIALIIPFGRFGRGGRQTALRYSCMNNIRQIGIALNQYVKDHGSYPPAYTVDAYGKPLHSWRTLILPYLEQKALYDSIDLTKPWDDPVNAKALQTKVEAYQCAASDLPPNHTGYLAVVTPKSCLRGDKSVTSAEITDGLDKTVILVEVPVSNTVPWMSPLDADETLFVERLRDKDQNHDDAQPTKWPHSGMMHVLFAAGNTLTLDTETAAAERRAMITIAGGD